MTKLFMTLVCASVTLASVAQAHDLKYTLIQDGSKQTASCTSKAMAGVTVDLFESGSGSGYMLLSSSDEDAGRTAEHLIKTTIKRKGHDSDIIKGEEITAEIASVGEGDVPMTANLKAKNTALRVWLKAYGQGSDLRTASFKCVLM